MLTSRVNRLIVVSALIVIDLAQSYVPGLITKRSTMTMRKGRKSLKKTINGGLGGKVSGVQPMGGEATVSKKTNWVPVAGISSISDLIQQQNLIQFQNKNVSSLRVMHCESLYNINGIQIHIFERL